MNAPVFLLVASYPDSLINFRGHLIKALQTAGCKVHVAAPGLREGTVIAGRLNELGVDFHDIPLQRTGLNPFRDMYTLLALCKLMIQTRPEYMMSYTIKPVIYGSLAGWLTGVSNRFALITGLGYAFIGESKGPRKLMRNMIQQLYRYSLSMNQRLFFQNPDDETLFRDLKLLKPSIPSCVVNGSGVDLSEYVVTPLPADNSFLFIGRLLGDKGVREYVSASAWIRQRHPDVVFQLAGWIDDNPDAIDQLELDEWVKAGTIEFLGKLEDVRPAISNSRVYVLPSYREGTPRTVLEAMAMGRPVITTDAPGCRETVVDGGNGFLVPVRAVQALAEAMEKFIEEPELIIKMGERSRATAEDKYDVHKVNAVMLKEMGLD